MPKLTVSYLYCWVACFKKVILACWSFISLAICNEKICESLLRCFRKPNLHHADILYDEHAFDIPHLLRFMDILLTLPPLTWPPSLTLSDGHWVLTASMSLVSPQALSEDTKLGSYHYKERKSKEQLFLSAKNTTTVRHLKGQDDT